MFDNDITVVLISLMRAILMRRHVYLLDVDKFCAYCLKFVVMFICWKICQRY